MWSFFHGWPRMVGVVTLGLACLVMITSVRGRFYDQDFRFRTRPHIVQALHSHRGEISWATYWEPDDGPRVTENDDGSEHIVLLISADKNVEWHSALRRRHLAIPFENARWSWRIGGARYGHEPTNPETGIGFRVLMISSIAVAVGLTLLSAYLILWKPRKWA